MLNQILINQYIFVKYILQKLYELYVRIKICNNAPCWDIIALNNVRIGLQSTDMFKSRKLLSSFLSNFKMYNLFDMVKDFHFVLAPMKLYMNVNKIFFYLNKGKSKCLYPKTYRSYVRQ